MKTITEQRSHWQVMAQWPVTYWNDELFGQGTVLNLSHRGCRVVGTMSVVDGMRIKLWISPPNQEDRLCVEEARVLWAKDYEFELAFQQLAAIDQRELAIVLQSAERGRSFQAILSSS